MAAEVELGPIDIVVIGFPADAPRTGSAIPIFVDLADRGVIRVLDVLAVQKNEDGSFAGFDVTDIDGDGENDLLLFEGARSGMLDDSDAATAAEVLEPGESAVMIVFENAWAARFVNEVRANGGQFLAFDRVPAADLLAAVEALDA